MEPHKGDTLIAQGFSGVARKGARFSVGLDIAPVKAAEWLSAYPDAFRIKEKPKSDTQKKKSKIRKNNSDKSSSGFPSEDTSLSSDSAQVEKLSGSDTPHVSS